MPNRTPLTAQAESLMFDLQIAAEREHNERIRQIAKEAARVFGQMDKERLEFIFTLNHGDSDSMRAAG